MHYSGSAGRHFSTDGVSGFIRLKSISSKVKRATWETAETSYNHGGKSIKVILQLSA